MNDVVGCLLLALITALVTTSLDAGSDGAKVGALIVFAVVAAFVVRPLLKRVLRRMMPPGAPLSANLLGILLAVMFFAGMTTYLIGIFAIFGAFFIGVLLHDEHQLRVAWRERVGHFVNVFFVPIFFTFTGLRTAIGGLDTLDAWMWCGVIIALACLGKLIGAYLAARACRLDHPQSASLAFMMNTRALMELIVVNVGYDLKILTSEMFTILTLMALLSTVMTTPALGRWMGVHVVRGGGARSPAAEGRAAAP